MTDQIRAAIATGDIESAFEASGPDESYTMTFAAPGGEMSGRFYRFGSQVYSVVLDTRPGEEEHTVQIMSHNLAHEDDAEAASCASAALSMIVERVRQAHALAKSIIPGIGDIQCTHRVGDSASLVGTLFAETVIPDGMDPTV